MKSSETGAAHQALSAAGILPVHEGRGGAEDGIVTAIQARPPMAVGLPSPRGPVVNLETIFEKRDLAIWASAALSLSMSPISFAMIVRVDRSQRDRKSAVRPDPLQAGTATLALGALTSVPGFSAVGDISVDFADRAGSEFLVFSAGPASIGLAGAGLCLPELRNGVAGTPNKPRMAPLNKLLPM